MTSNISANSPSRNEKSIRIGELLILSGVINENKWEGVLTFANQMRLPVGKVLCLQGHLTEDRLRDALTVQSYIRDGVLSLENGIKALKVSITEGLELDTAIKKLGWVSVGTEAYQTNKLGELAIECNLITKSELKQGLKASYESGIPLGIVLTDLGYLNKDIKNKLLIIQKLVRNNLLDRHTGVQIIRVMRNNNLSFRECLILHNIDYDSIVDLKNLEELLIRANIINTTDLATINELVIQSDKSFTDILVNNGYISQKILEYVKYLLQIIDEGSIYLDHAVMIIKKLSVSDMSLEDVIDEILDSESDTSNSAKLAHFLVSSNLISQKTADEIFKYALDNKTSFTSSIKSLNILNDFILNQAEFLNNLLNLTLIEPEQAQIILYYSIENNINANEAIKLFGWVLDDN